MSEIGKYIYSGRLEKSIPSHSGRLENFYSDHSSIVFSTSFRRMMQKAQVFSLESNTSVRNRLTHSLEVADIGKTIARRIGQLLVDKGLADIEDVECMQSIVENACLIHDIGNPPFGHFGEEAIKQWFKLKAPDIFRKSTDQMNYEDNCSDLLFDFYHFDGNPQGLRIVSCLHSDLGRNGLNLTYSTILASIKYPNIGMISNEKLFGGKVGIFRTEEQKYRDVCVRSGHDCGKRYFLVYVMELADDISYCLSDIADGFEKKLIFSRDFKEGIAAICKKDKVDISGLIPDRAINNFGFQVSMRVAEKVIRDACIYFVENIDKYISGDAVEIIDDIESGRVLKCFKKFARQYIYTQQEVERIEIAGEKIVEGLLDHYGRLLNMKRDDFLYFVQKGDNKKRNGLDTEWRIFNQMSKRMLSVYDTITDKKSIDREWVSRAHFIVDYISGLTDNYALESYQNFMGISL